ncbi:segregation/condensation protein A [Roseospira marina]|uniref:Segregation and condensation protein A n=1 Tax=Roseospira marina TaxID=140057 RepID=A0A5M6IF45_9PROT|nr:ScpA family protein [Roseospira marina]KAA5606900.1 segregation/condensation protein A [Roseospira marina]MBB4312929.1 segregation and condensation protein A [Roseospira marina]MBB5086298.1 segregation and condensation protein A [Roseospira marina]
MTGPTPRQDAPPPGDPPPFADDGERAPSVPDALVVNLDGFDGPLDVLLALARDQKVDLARLSILHLAEQYLAFVRAARERHLDLAADYLVMAAWLAFLKSRLLLPVPQADDEPSGAEMAAALHFQLQRLEAMRTAGRALMERPRLGRDTLVRGAPEAVSVIHHTVFDVTLHDLLRAYADLHRRSQNTALSVEPFDLYSVEQALARLNGLLGTTVEWTALLRFLPKDLASGLGDGLLRRSAIGATFVATLELARQGKAEVRQDGGPFSPLYVRRRDPEDDDGGE